MTAMELVENYSYNIDASSIVFCVILLLIIRFVLYFSQAELCSDWGADYLQGFKYSKPIPIKEVRDYFVRH